ncbi:putative leader peptide [Streptomyces sp. NPDC001902]
MWNRVRAFLTGRTSCCSIEDMKRQDLTRRRHVDLERVSSSFCRRRA